MQRKTLLGFENRAHKGPEEGGQFRFASGASIQNLEFSVGEKIKCTFSPDKLIFFDPATERRIG